MDYTQLKLGVPSLVEWEDSCCASDWRDAGELAELENLRCFSMGWVVRLTDKSVTLAPYISAPPEYDLCAPLIPKQSNGHMVIPLSAIRRILPLYTDS